MVLNSGHTFHAAEFRGTNALLYSPAWAIFAFLKLTGDKNDPLAAEVILEGGTCSTTSGRFSSR